MKNYVIFALAVAVPPLAVWYAAFPLLWLVMYFTAFVVNVTVIGLWISMIAGALIAWIAMVRVAWRAL